MQPIVLVKKTYPRYRKRQRNRMWKLKHFDDLKKDDIEMGSDEEEEVKEKEKKGRKPRGKKENRNKEDNKDYQLFLQDLEEDKDLRAQVNLYKDDGVMAELEKRMAGMAIEEDEKPIKKAKRQTE